MVRIGSFAAQNFTLSRNLETQARMDERRIQISSGKKAQAYDGIARDARRLEGLETRHAQNAAFTSAITRTDQRLQEMESAVGNMFQSATELRTLLLDAGSGDKLDATNIVAQAGKLLDSVTSELNVRMDGRYLFAGSATDTQPVDTGVGSFAPGNTDYYQGNGDVLSVRAAGDLNLAYGVTAADDGFRDLLGGLKRIVDAAPLTNADIEAALGEVNAAIRRIPDVQADLGSARDVLDRTKQRLTDQQVNTEKAIGEIEDVDVAEAMTQLSADQVTLDSSYAVTARLSRTSLLNYLR
jgi:flagellar hook-associated protein 3 FlgL